MEGRRGRIFPAKQFSFAHFAVAVCSLFFVAPHANATTSLPASISSNTTLTAAGGPYIGSGVTVASGVTLTAEKGSVIKITGLLKVEGTLSVNGTTGEP
ncbi:MAG TPA: hypothetical protein VJQ84_11255, partial [Solirubrobacterales bacterium]|nr:hypothetical protein [Solirubrobacterales bacterium]